MTFENWAPPHFRLGQDAIALWNAAMSYADLAIPIADRGEFSFTPLGGAAGVSAMRQILLDGKAFGYGRVDFFPFQSYSGIALDVADLANLPTELSGALDEGMLMTVLSVLPDELTTRLQLGSSVSMTTLLSHAEARDLQWFSCALSDLAEEPIAFTFAAPPKKICSELAAAAPIAQEVHSALGRLLTSRAERLVGTVALSLTEINGLAPGDFILFSQTNPEGQCTILVDRQVFFFTADDFGWSCIDVLPLDHLVAANKANAFAKENDLLTSLDEIAGEETQEMAPSLLEVNVSFCLGSTDIALGELESWQRGALVTLPEEISAEDTQVTVRANGVAVAQGDLVRIDDRLAVRLNRILLKPSSQKG